MPTSNETFRKKAASLLYCIPGLLAASLMAGFITVSGYCAFENRIEFEPQKMFFEILFADMLGNVFAAPGAGRFPDLELVKMAEGAAAIGGLYRNRAIDGASQRRRLFIASIRKARRNFRDCLSLAFLCRNRCADSRNPLAYYALLDFPSRDNHARIR